MDRALRWFRRNWSLLAMAGTVGVLGAFAGNVAIEGLRESFWSQEAAGWAQAVGTVVAIVFAWWQGQRAWHLADKQKRDTTLRFLGHLAGLIDQALSVVGQAEEGLLTSKLAVFEVEILKLMDQQRHLQKVSEIPVQDWPSPALSSAVDLAYDALRDVTKDGLILPRKSGRG